MKVTVFGFEDCPFCQKTKRFLQARGVEYEVRDIELDEEAAAECKRISGDLAVPVTTIDGKNYVVGFDKRKIEELLASA
ncbi:MAG: glutaredoxin family protein [Selenomonadaceae bacterium]|nr:glutaredoxin family protein [Selenomonadaceae bacterium]